MSPGHRTHSFIGRSQMPPQQLVTGLSLMLEEKVSARLPLGPSSPLEDDPWCEAIWSSSTSPPTTGSKSSLESSEEEDIVAIGWRAF